MGLFQVEETKIKFPGPLAAVKSTVDAWLGPNRPQSRSGGSKAEMVRISLLYERVV